jgi:hypothetical protein
MAPRLQSGSIILYTCEEKRKGVFLRVAHLTLMERSPNLIGTVDDEWLGTWVMSKMSTWTPALVFWAQVLRVSPQFIKRLRPLASDLLGLSGLYVPILWMVSLSV